MSRDSNDEEEPSCEGGGARHVEQQVRRPHGQSIRGLFRNSRKEVRAHSEEGTKRGEGVGSDWGSGWLCKASKAVLRVLFYVCEKSLECFKQANI